MGIAQASLDAAIDYAKMRVESELKARLLKMTGESGPMNPLVDDVLDRRIDPYTAANHILREFFIRN